MPLVAFIAFYPLHDQNEMNVCKENTFKSDHI